MTDIMSLTLGASVKGGLDLSLLYNHVSDITSHFWRSDWNWVFSLCLNCIIDCHSCSCLVGLIVVNLGNSFFLLKSPHFTFESPLMTPTEGLFTRAGALLHMCCGLSHIKLEMSLFERHILLYWLWRHAFDVFVYLWHNEKLSQRMLLLNLIF